MIKLKLLPSSCFYVIEHKLISAVFWMQEMNKNYYWIQQMLKYCWKLWEETLINMWLCFNRDNEIKVSCRIIRLINFLLITGQNFISGTLDLAEFEETNFLGFLSSTQIQSVSREAVFLSSILFQNNPLILSPSFKLSNAELNKFTN